MADKHAIFTIIKNAGDTLANGILEMWFLVTVGLLFVLGFLGKRTLNKWDSVIDSHVPNKIIDKRFSKTYEDMTNCQKELKGDISEVKDSVSEVHGRVDDIMHYLMTGESKRPGREAERKKDE